jgi:hypothetical protein
MNIIKKYENLSLRYKLYHSKSQNYYSAWNTRLNITNMIVVSIIGVSNNLTVSLNIDNKPLSICYSIVLYLSVLLSTLQQFLKYEELAEKHRVCSIRYSHLYNICLMSRETEIKGIIEEYENIYKTAPSIPNNIKSDDVETSGHSQDIIDIATSHQLNRLALQSYKS